MTFQKLVLLVFITTVAYVVLNHNWVRTVTRLVIDATRPRDTFFRLLKHKPQEVTEIKFLFRPDETYENCRLILRAARIFTLKPVFATGMPKHLRYHRKWLVLPFHGCVSELIRDAVLEYVAAPMPNRIRYYMTSRTREVEILDAYRYDAKYKISTITSCVHATVLKYFFSHMKYTLSSKNEGPRLQLFFNTYLK